MIEDDRIFTRDRGRPLDGDQKDQNMITMECPLLRTFVILFKKPVKTYGVRRSKKTRPRFQYSEK